MTTEGTYLVSATNLPQDGYYGVSYWERTGDPFHPDAFKGLGLDENTVLVTVGGTMDTTSSRKSGWMAIDWIENPVGFVKDGTEMKGTPPEVVIQPGPYKHLCAYYLKDVQNPAFADEYLKRHAEMLAQTLSKENKC